MIDFGNFIFYFLKTFQTKYTTIQNKNQHIITETNRQNLEGADERLLICYIFSFNNFMKSFIFHTIYY